MAGKRFKATSASPLNTRAFSENFVFVGELDQFVFSNQCVYFFEVLFKAFKGTILDHQTQLRVSSYDEIRKAGGGFGDRFFGKNDH